MSGVQTRLIGPDDGDQRVDRYLRRLFPHLTQGRIEKMCRKGELRVDGGRVKTNTRLEVGQTVRIPPLPSQAEADAARALAQRGVSKADARLIQSCVIYRDDHIIAINKPPGLATQGGSKTTRHVDGMAEALTFGYEEKPRLVHRLDKDTSGVLLLARTRTMAKQLTENLKHRETRKIYWAAVAGVPHPRAGTIKYGLVRPPVTAGEAKTKKCAAYIRATWTRSRAQSGPLRITPSWTRWPAARPGARWCPSPGAPISCARTWPRSGTRL